MRCRTVCDALLALGMALAVSVLLWAPCVGADDVPKSLCPTPTCRHTYGFAYEFYFGESAVMEEPETASAARFADHTALTIQLWVRPYSVPSGVGQSLVSDYAVDAETGEQYNCGLYLMPFNDTTSTPAFFAGHYDYSSKVICLFPSDCFAFLTHFVFPHVSLTHFIFHVLFSNTEQQSQNVSWKSTSGIT